MTKCSVILLAWNRPENINQILERYNAYETVGEIIVWNNNGRAFVADLSLGKVKTLNCNVDFGLNSRFVAALLAQNRCVIVHDDDLLLSEHNLRNLVSHFEIDHTRLYTYEGRVPQNGAYTHASAGRVENVTTPTEVPIALTRSSCFDRLYAAEYAKIADVMFYDVDKNLNGEDIVFSYMTAHLSGKPPLVLPVPDTAGYVELPAEYSGRISTRPRHLERRTELVKRCEIILPLPKYPAPDSKKIVFFGAGNYPFAYYNDSFNTDSPFKKLLVKETNGIKYLSLMAPGSRGFSSTALRCDFDMTPTDTLHVSLFFRGTPRALGVYLTIQQDNKSLIDSDSRLLTVPENYPRQSSLRLQHFFGSGATACRVKGINFSCFNPDGDTHDVELCFSEMYIDTRPDTPSDASL